MMNDEAPPAADKSADWSVVLAGAIFCVALGSVHAFSVFLAPLEAAFGVSRASVSMIYSTALVALTASVLFGPVIYGRASGAMIVLIAGGAAAAGLPGGSTVAKSISGFRPRLSYRSLRCALPT